MVLTVGSTYSVCDELPQQSTSVLCISAQVTSLPALMPRTVLSVQFSETRLLDPERFTGCGS